MILSAMAPGGTDLVASDDVNSSETDVPLSSKQQESPPLGEEMDLGLVFDDDRQLSLPPTPAVADGGSDATALKELWSSSSPTSSPNSSSKEDKKDVWQNEENDMPHRRELIRQVAKLLKDRKANPTSKWLKELPYKARKLEEQLYRSAPNLEAYIDKTTLKQRLKRVAKAITTQFRVAKRKSSSSTRSSSVSSRSSMTSIGSIGSVSVDSTGGDSASMPLPLSVGAELPDLSSTSISTVPSLAQTPESLDELQQKQALNQKLQQEILENIRQQQQIMRDLLEQQKKQQQLLPEISQQEIPEMPNTDKRKMEPTITPPTKLNKSPKDKKKTSRSSLTNKKTKGFNHKELMAAAQTDLQNAMLNSNNFSQRRISAPNPAQLMAAQQAFMNNTNLAGMGGRSHSAPPLNPAMMAAMQNSMGGGAGSGMTGDASMMAAAAAAGLGPMNQSAMNMNPNNLNFMGGGQMMTPQQQAAFLQQQQQQLQQQLQQKNSLMPPPDNTMGENGINSLAAIGGNTMTSLGMNSMSGNSMSGTVMGLNNLSGDTLGENNMGGNNLGGFHPTMPPPSNNMMASSLRSSFTGNATTPTGSGQLSLSPNSMGSSPAPSDVNGDFSLSPSTFNW